MRVTAVASASAAGVDVDGAIYVWLFALPPQVVTAQFHSRLCMRAPVVVSAARCRRRNGEMDRAERGGVGGRGRGAGEVLGDCMLHTAATHTHETTNS